MKERISVTGNENTNRRNKKLTFNNNAPLRSCISKINNTFIDNAEYSDNFSMTSESLWNFYRDEVNDSTNEIDDNDNMIDKNKITRSKSFKYKTKMIASTSNNNSRLNAKVVVPLKHLNNFLRSLDLLLIILRTFREADRNADSVADAVVTATTGATFQINNVKLHVPVVTLSINDNIEFLENIKQGYKRTISWDKNRSGITTQTKSNNLDYLIDPTFRNINRLFVLSFKNGDHDPTRNSFDEYCMPSVKVKDFNA